jgi:hypothetical protein
MLGIPLEPHAEYPESAQSILLTKSAANDPNILDKVKQSLINGADVIVTSGFIAATTPDFQHIANIEVTCRKAKSSRFACSDNMGVNFGGCNQGRDEIIIPQLEYPTNDVWEIAAAFGCDNSFPMLLKTLYGKGRLWVLTIPDDYGDLYTLPKEVLLVIRKAMCERLGFVFDGPPNVALFAYDNSTFAVRSFMPYYDYGHIIINRECSKIIDLQTDKEIICESTDGITSINIRIEPGTNQFFKLYE